MIVCQSCEWVAGMVLALIFFALPTTFKLVMWQDKLLGIGIQIMACIPNVIGGKTLPRLEVLAFIVHILGFFAILIPLSFMPEHRGGNEFFTPFLNAGHFKARPLTWLFGITYYNGLFLGGDCAVHVSSSIHVDIPRALTGYIACRRIRRSSSYTGSYNDPVGGS